MVPLVLLPKVITYIHSSQSSAILDSNMSNEKVTLVWLAHSSVYTPRVSTHGRDNKGRSKINISTVFREVVNKLIFLPFINIFFDI